MKSKTRTSPSKTFQFIFPGIEQIKNELAKLEKALKDYGHDNLFYQTDSEDFKEIIKRIETIEGDVKCIYDKDEQSSPLAKSLVDLEKVFKNNENYIHEFYPEKEPEFVDKIKELIGEKIPANPQLEVGGALKKHSEANEYIGFIGNWVRMANKVEDYLDWSDKIQVVIPDMNGKGRIRKSWSGQLRLSLKSNMKCCRL